MKLHCFDVTFNPTNYELSDSVAATEGVLLYSGFPDYNALAPSPYIRVNKHARFDSYIGL